MEANEEGNPVSAKAPSWMILVANFGGCGAGCLLLDRPRVVNRHLGGCMLEQLERHQKNK